MAIRLSGHQNVQPGIKHFQDQGNRLKAKTLVRVRQRPRPPRVLGGIRLRCEQKLGDRIKETLRRESTEP